MRLEGPFQIARMVLHLKLPLDQRRNALQGPAFGGKAGRHRALVQEPPQTGPVLLIKARGASRNGSRFQTAPALMGEGSGPARDTGPTGPQLPRDLGLGEPSL